MLMLAMIILIAVAWLVWEWKSAALAPQAGSAGRKTGSTSGAGASRLPTAAALLVDADVTARLDR